MDSPFLSVRSAADHHFEQRGAKLPLGANEQRGAKSTRNPLFIKLLLDVIRIPDRMQSIFVGNSVFVRTLRPRNRHSTNVLHNTMLMQYITFHPVSYTHLRA